MERMGDVIIAKKANALKIVAKDPEKRTKRGTRMVDENSMTSI